MELTQLKSAELKAEVEALLVHEAELLDDHRWGDWLAMLTDDFEYLLPVPVTRDNPGLPGYFESTYLQAENRATLDDWVERLSPENVETAWAENPPARVRHFIANVRPSPGEVDGELLVRTNVLVSISRGAEDPILFSSERRDVLRRSDGGWKLAHRKVYLDQNIPNWSMRIIV
jgi:3-phenylpropionate/cinnamic acid dioxygenase small subunit